MLLMIRLFGNFKAALSRHLFYLHKVAGHKAIVSVRTIAVDLDDWNGDDWSLALFRLRLSHYLNLRARPCLINVFSL